MKINIYLLIVSLLIVCQSCVEDVVNNTFYCEEDGEFLGNKVLSDTSNAFWSYEEGQKLYFKNDVGNEIEFKQTAYDSTMSAVQTRVVCGGIGLPDYEFDYINAEQRLVRFESDDTPIAISMSLSIFPWGTGTATGGLSYIEIFNLQSSSAYYYFATDIEGSSEIPTYMLSSNYERVDTTLLGEYFEDAFSSNIDYRGFYTKEKGLVAFYDYNNVLYVLDRIE